MLSVAACADLYVEGKVSRIRSKPTAEVLAPKIWLNAGSSVNRAWLMFVGEVYINELSTDVTWGVSAKPLCCVEDHGVHQLVEPVVDVLVARTQPVANFVLVVDD